MKKKQFSDTRQSNFIQQLNIKMQPRTNKDQKKAEKCPQSSMQGLYGLQNLEKS